MAVLTPVPKFTAFDSNGDPLNAGLVYTYAANSDTPLATYTDNTGNTENANPVVLDAAGRANIWLGAAAYKFVVKNSAGVTQYTVDYVSGQNLITGNLDAGGFRITNLGAASARTDAARASQVQDSTLTLIGSVAGTNTITGSLTPAITAYASGQKFVFVPANTNTGATTININSVGAVSIFWNGAACVGGELRQNIPCEIEYDGTRFNIIANGFAAPFLDTYPVVEGSSDSTKKARFEVDGLTTATTRVVTIPDRNVTIGGTLGTEVSASGTAVEFTSIPAGTRRITIMLNAVSLSGNTELIVQIGDSGGFEATAYNGSSCQISNGGATSGSNPTTSWRTTSAASAAGYSGAVVLNLMNSSTFEWVCSGMLNRNDAAVVDFFGGAKTLSAELDRVRIASGDGASTFDGGLVNISYE